MDASWGSLGGLAGGLLGLASTVPYVRDMARGRTLPHRGSWLIWSVLELVAVASHGADGARWLLLPLAGQAAGTVVIFLGSLWRGVGGLSRGDLTMVALAGGGVAGWATLDRPLVATACVVLADLVGMVLMLPKAWRTPFSETASTFALASVGGAMAVLAADARVVELLLYPAYFCVVNAAMAATILTRRGAVSAGADAPPPSNTPASEERRDRGHDLVPGVHRAGDGALA